MTVDIAIHMHVRNTKSFVICNNSILYIHSVKNSLKKMENGSSSTENREDPFYQSCLHEELENLKVCSDDVCTKKKEQPT